MRRPETHPDIFAADLERLVALKLLAERYVFDARVRGDRSTVIGTEELVEHLELTSRDELSKVAPCTGQPDACFLRDMRS